MVAFTAQLNVHGRNLPVYEWPIGQGRTRESAINAAARAAGIKDTLVTSERVGDMAFAVEFGRPARGGGTTIVATGVAHLETR